MKISELIQKVKEHNLSREQLEQYYTELTSLSAEMELALADLEKAEAKYLNESEEKTRSGADRLWKSTPEGQEEISLKRNLRAVDKLRSSIKHRIFNQL